MSAQRQSIPLVVRRVVYASRNAYFVHAQPIPSRLQGVIHRLNCGRSWHKIIVFIARTINYRVIWKIL